MGTRGLDHLSGDDAAPRPADHADRLHSRRRQLQDGRRRRLGASYELSFLQVARRETARMEFGIGTSASSMASTIDAYARAGIRPLLLAGFRGRLPTASEAQNLGSWAAPTVPAAPSGRARATRRTLR